MKIKEDLKHDLIIYAVTHEMMSGFQNNHRLKLSEAEKLFEKMATAIESSEYINPRPEILQLEEIKFRLGDHVTFMRLLNHGPLIGFRNRRILTSRMIRQQTMGD